MRKYSCNICQNQINASNTQTHLSAISENRASLGSPGAAILCTDPQLLAKSIRRRRSSCSGFTLSLHSSKSISCQTYGLETARPQDLQTLGITVSTSSSERLRKMRPSASGISSSHPLNSAESPIQESIKNSAK